MSFQIRDSLFQRNSNCRKFRIFVEIFTKFRLFITIHGPHKFKFSPSKFFPSWKLYLWMKNDDMEVWTQQLGSIKLDCLIFSIVPLQMSHVSLHVSLRVLFRLSARLVKLQKLHFFGSIHDTVYKIIYFSKIWNACSIQLVVDDSSWLKWLWTFVGAWTSIWPHLWFWTGWEKKIAPTYFLTVLNLEQLLGIQLQ